jgi:tRNA-binding protein
METPIIKPIIQWSDFEKIDIRVGTVINADKNTHAVKPALILEIDFGQSIGIKKTSAQITTLYTPEKLIGKQVIAVVNFKEKQIGKMKSQCLILGAIDADSVNLLTMDTPCINGLNIG